MADTAHESYFDGNTFQLIGWRILMFLLMFITLGIGFPWAVCMMQRWEIKHTVINGRRLKFTGHGHQLLGWYIVWTLLTLITFGIYSIWVGLGMKKWVVKHTVYADDDSGVESRFNGGAVGWFVFHMLYGLLAFVTLGIGIPWGKAMLLRWEAEHTEIGGKALVFSGTGGQLFVKYLINFLLVLVTLGIYTLFIPVGLLKWQVSNTTQGSSQALEDEVSTALVVVGAIALTVVVALGIIGAVLVWALITPRFSAEPSKPPQIEPVNQTEMSAGEFGRTLIGGEWSNVRRRDNTISVVYYGFPAEGEVYITSCEYLNIHTDPFFGEEGDEYGWFVAPMGYPTFYGNYSLTALGDNSFAMTADGAYDFIDISDQYTYELTYVDDNMILIDGETYVRGEYTLAEYAGIFGFAIEAEAAG